MNDDAALQLALSNADPVEVSHWLREHVRSVAARGGRTQSTERAYVAAAMRILPFLDAHGLTPTTITPELAASALLALGMGAPPYQQPCAASSVRLTATAIRVAMVSQGHNPGAWDSPVVRATLRDLDKRRAPRAIVPIRIDDLRRMISVVAPSAVGIRIRTALLVSYAGALRVSEAASLTWARMSASGQDVIVQVQRKRHASWDLVTILAASDQTLCPVRALGELRRIDGLGPHVVDAPLFGAPRTIQGWVQAIATRAGLQGSVTPHSLRHGWASDAASAGIPLPAIQRHLGHASATTTSRYASHAELRRFY